MSLLGFDLGTDVVSLLLVVLIIAGLLFGWFEVSFNINVPIAISILGLGGAFSMKSIVSSMFKAFKMMS